MTCESRASQSMCIAPGTIYTAAEEIERAGGKALPIQCDIRDEDQIIHAINQSVKQ